MVVGGNGWLEKLSGLLKAGDGLLAMLIVQVRCSTNLEPNTQPT